MPNDAELARTGLSFSNGFCNTAMCSPSRADPVHRPLSGRARGRADADRRRPAAGPAQPARRSPATMARHPAPHGGAGEAGDDAVRPRRSAAWGRAAAARPSCRPTSRTSPRLLRAPGYDVAYKGKWHLTHPLGGEGSMLGGWSPARRERIERDYGFADWEPPDAGENAKAETSAAATPATGRGGTRSTRARSSAGSPPPTRRSRFAWSSRSSTPMTCSATPPSTWAAATRATSSAISACGCRRRSTRTWPASPPCTR